MFKTKITLINAQWNTLDEYKSRVKPSVGEDIWSKKHKCYYRVLRVIHSLKNGFELVLVVEKLEELKLN